MEMACLLLIQCFPTPPPAVTHRHLLRILGPGKGALPSPTSISGPAESRLGICGNQAPRLRAPKPQPSCLCFCCCPPPPKEGSEGRQERQEGTSQKHGSRGPPATTWHTSVPIPPVVPRGAGNPQIGRDTHSASPGELRPEAATTAVNSYSKMPLQVQVPQPHLEKTGAQHKRMI